MNPPVRQSNEVAAFAKTTILVVEDNHDHLSLITLALKQCMPGVNAVGVSDKDAAMTYVATSWHERSAVPRLVLLDLYLPTPVEGLSVMTDLKDYFRSNNQPPMPVIVFSSSEKSEDIKASYDHGANSYMVKSADYRDWLNYFEILRQFWLQTVTLPPLKR